IYTLWSQHVVFTSFPVVVVFADLAVELPVDQVLLLVTSHWTLARVLPLAATLK
ncbi:hypothetical protein NDU88_005276, partial [Pleurodeles waltl]